MPQGLKEKKSHSMWNIFGAKLNHDSDIAEAYQRAFCLKKACSTSRTALIDTLQLRAQDKRQGLPKKQNDFHSWKVGDQLVQSSDVITDVLSPVKVVLKKVGDLHKQLAVYQKDFEANLQKDIGSGQIYTLITKEYPAIMKDKETFLKRQKEYENSEYRYQKERQRRERNQDDPELMKQTMQKENQLKENMLYMKEDLQITEDKLITSTLNVLANDREYAFNLMQYVVNLQAMHSSVLDEINRTVDELGRFLGDSPRRRVFGEELGAHLRVTSSEVARPLELAVRHGLLDNLKEEGVFRVGPGLNCLKRLKASIDAGFGLKNLPQTYHNPHLWTGIIKSYLRELPRPLFVPERLAEWTRLSKLKDKTEMLKEIRQLLDTLPEINKENIGFLFLILAEVVKESDHNKMTSDNVGILLSPNLLWDPDTGQAVGIDNVVAVMIDHAWELFDTDGLSRIKHCLSIPSILTQVPEDTSDEVAAKDEDKQQAAKLRLGRTDESSHSDLRIKVRKDASHDRLSGKTKGDRIRRNSDILPLAVSISPKRSPAGSRSFRAKQGVDTKSLLNLDVRPAGQTLERSVSTKIPRLKSPFNLLQNRIKRSKSTDNG